jgi:hypothetical protein
LGYFNLEADNIAVLVPCKRRLRVHRHNRSRLDLFKELEPGVTEPVETPVNQTSQVADLHIALNVHLANTVEGLFGGVKALEKDDESVTIGPRKALYICR